MRSFNPVGLISQQAWLCAVSSGYPGPTVTTPCVGGLCITMIIFNHPHRHSVCSTTLYVCTSHRSVNANRPRMVCIIEVYDWLISNKQNVEGGFSWHGLKNKLKNGDGLYFFLWCSKAVWGFIYIEDKVWAMCRIVMVRSWKLCCTYFYFLPRNISVWVMIWLVCESVANVIRVYKHFYTYAFILV